MHRYDKASLERYLCKNVPGFTTLDAMDRFGQGQSNPTYEVQSNGKRFVLRAKPMGKLLPSAHAVDREFRVMTALADTNVPVPGTYHLADDENPLGVAFFVMEHVEGHVYWNPSLPGLTRDDRTRVYFAMCDVLADLHDVVPAAVGLSDFGKPDGYFERQFSLWRRQYAASATVDRPDVAYLEAWLTEALPRDDAATCIVHGDYRIDNMIFAADQRILALLDWELSTLGHPLADLAYQCMMWRMPNDGQFKGLRGVERQVQGLPPDDAYIGRYCARRGIDVPDNWSAYVCFSAYRFVAILQGVLKRGIDGTAANPIGTDAMDGAIDYLAADAADLARHAG